jgi:capsular polysaccharide biosynthesis protein
MRSSSPALVAQLSQLPQVDVICPEELTFEQKLSLYRRYEVVVGFPQASMALTMFVPGEPLAQQVMLLAGPRCLSSTWVNVDRATAGGDAYVDCEPADMQPMADDSSAPFQRSNRFKVETALQAIQALSR